MQTLEIIRTLNGYAAVWREDHCYVEMSFEEEDSEFGEVECFSRLLWWITEHFGMIGSKHDKRRIRITPEISRNERSERSA